MTSLWQNLAAFALAPLMLWLIAFGYGLLLERLCRVRLPNALLIPTGFCASVVVALASYETRVGNVAAIPLLVTPAVAGLVLHRHDLRTRINAGWASLAALLTYLIFELSVLATGHWTFTGYALDNDSSYELVLISHLQAHGLQPVSGPPSTANTVVSGYFATGYPLGSQSLLGVISGVLGVPAVVIWQSFISAMAAIGTLAASTLPGRTMSPRAAAGAGFLAVSSALFYAFALQGSIKEIGVAVAILSALALGRHAILSLAGPRSLIVLAVPLAAILAIFNAAGLPYVGSLVLVGSLALILVRRARPQRNWLGPAIGGAVALLVMSIPALLTIGSFFNAITVSYGGSHPAAPPLGPLFRPLPLSEMSGVWLYGDYRSKVPGGLAGLATAGLSLIMFGLLVPAVWRSVKNREPGILAGLGMTALVLAVVYPQVVPYAQAKLLMLAAPIVVLAALQGLTAFRARVVRLGTAIVALGIGGAILASDAAAYYAFPVAPVDRLLALRQVGHRLGPRGPVLDSEFEEFAKYFAQPAELIDGPDSPTPEPLTLRTPTLQYDRSFDLNEETLQFIESFPYVLTRRSPVTSPPPANYRLLFANSFYELWQRQTSPRVYAHLPLAGSGIASGARPACSAVRALIAGAPPGARLAEALLSPAYGYRPADAAPRPARWVASSAVSGGLMTYPPGRVQRTVDVATSGPFRAWVQGSFPRSVEVFVDGRRVGTVTGNDTPEGWLSAGTTSVSAGAHTLEVLKPGADLSPGNGYTQAEIDAVVLAEADVPERIRFTPVRQWRELCTESAAWIELVG